MDFELDPQLVISICIALLPFAMVWVAVLTLKSSKL